MQREMFEVVGRHPDGTYQLFGANGLVAHTAPDTVVEPGAELRPGARVFADTISRGARNVAHRIGRFETVDPEERLRSLLAAYREAYIEIEVEPSFARDHEGDLEAALWRKLEKTGPVFPRCRWNDAALQLADARALLAQYDVALGDVPLYFRDADRICRAIVDAANKKLGERCFYEIESCPHPDPIARWILVTPRQRDVLRSRGILRQGEAAQVQRASVVRRIAAKLIDCLVAGVAIIGFSHYFGAAFGIPAGYSWLLLSDWSGSPGKSLLKLRAVDHRTGAECTLVQSILRNLPLLSSALPRVWSLLSLILQMVEAVKASSDPEGRRFGDRWAGTKVISRH